MNLNHIIIKWFHWILATATESCHDSTDCQRIGSPPSRAIKYRAGALPAISIDEDEYKHDEKKKKPHWNEKEWRKGKRNPKATSTKSVDSIAKQKQQQQNISLIDSVLAILAFMPRASEQHSENLHHFHSNPYQLIYVNESKRLSMFVVMAAYSLFVQHNKVNRCPKK